jgi:hypothetical protein
LLRASKTIVKGANCYACKGKASEILWAVISSSSSVLTSQRKILYFAHGASREIGSLDIATGGFPSTRYANAPTVHRLKTWYYVDIRPSVNFSG